LKEKFSSCFAFFRLKTFAIFQCQAKLFYMMGEGDARSIKVAAFLQDQGKGQGLDKGLELGRYLGFNQGKGPGRDD
jgi:hypothetical protein